MVQTLRSSLVSFHLQGGSRGWRRVLSASGRDQFPGRHMFRNVPQVNSHLLTRFPVHVKALGLVIGVQVGGIMELKVSLRGVGGGFAPVDMCTTPQAGLAQVCF